jgi:acetylornithine/N-succinyldiaminopimelate aminotransferase
LTAGDYPDAPAFYTFVIGASQFVANSGDLGQGAGPISLGLTGLPEAHHNAQHDDPIPRRTPTPLRSPRGASLRPTTVTLELPDVTKRPQKSAAFYFAAWIQSEDRNMKFDDFPASALMNITTRPPLVFVRGEGSWLWDHEGKRYLDFVQGWAVNCLGHSPAVITNALVEQSRKLITPSPAFYNEPSMRLAKCIVEHSCFQRVFFTNSGAEANEGAIKLARKWGALNKGGAYEIITFEDSFHGRTLATMSASGKPQFRELFEPKVPGFPKAKLNDLASVERLITDKTVAVMLEPIQGETGVIIATDGFMGDLRALTQQRGLLLIVDEIQTGVGRTGKLWGYEHSGVVPDIMTLGKGLGGGVPLAALVAKEKVSCFEPGDQGGTFNGNPLMAAVGCAIMDVMLAPGFLQAVEERGAYLMKGLSDLSARLGLGEVRGRGLLVALDLKHDIATRLVDIARDDGLLLNAPRPNLLRFMPALTLSREETDIMLTMLEDGLRRVMKS